MAQNPVLKESKFENEIAAARQQWGSPPPGSFAGSRAEQSGTPTTGAPPESFPTMTLSGTAMATGILLFLVTAAGAFGWTQVVEPTVSVGRNGQPIYGAITVPPWLIGAFVVGIIFSLISAFKPKLARFTAPLYAVSFGTVVGAISHIYDIRYNGIALQAFGATISVATVMWVLYATKILKVTARMRAVVMGATLGIMVLYLAAFLLSLAGVNIRFWDEPSPLGIGLSLFIVGVAAFNLALDFDFTDRAIAAGSPKYMEWYAAYGITVTLVWLYLEILRLLSLLNRR